MQLKAGRYGSIFLAGMLAMLVGNRALAGDSEQQGTTPPLPTEVRLNPAAMPEIAAATPPLGWRYAQLSHSQTRVLRRGFRLPMESLAAARSPQDLVGAAILAPLPDPSRPILAVKAAASGGSSNPFNQSLSTSFRDDPMGALGQLLGADESNELSPAALGESFATDPFAAPADSGTELDEVPSAPSEKAAPADDPFAIDDEDDPFGDF